MKNFNDSITRSLAEICEDAVPKDIIVTDGELKIAAAKMARKGYDFSRCSNTLDVLRAYLEGKQLALRGSPGTGKTMFFKAISMSGVSRHRIIIYSLTEHGGDFESSIVEDIRSCNDCELVVDDVGNESDWNGKRDDVILPRILAVREQSQCRTHITTNLSSTEIKERYDERVVSRLRSYKWFAVVGKDNRTTTTNPAEAAFKARRADPANWTLCRERCSAYLNGRCSKGNTTPPILFGENGGTPESVCDVGLTIPYSNDHIKAEDEFREHLRELNRRHGLADPESPKD